MSRGIVVGFPLIPTIFAIIAYFMYGKSLDAALAVFLLDILWSLTFIVAVIPFVGIFLYYYVIKWIFGWVHSLTGLTWSWLFVSILIFFYLTGLKRECKIIDGKKICRWVRR